MKNPCDRNCPERSATCHGKCEKYAAYVAWNEERKRVRVLDNIHPDGARKTTTELLKKQRR